MPSVGNFRQGMIVSVPLHLDACRGSRPAPTCAPRSPRTTRAPIRQSGERSRNLGSLRLEPESLNGTNDMLIHVYDNEARRQAVLAAKFDNLGKGASGAAVQNWR